MNDEKTHALLELMLKKISEMNQNFLWQSLGESRIHTFYQDDIEIKFFLPLGRTDAIQKGILANSSFFEQKILNIVRSYISPSFTVLDAGANIGNHTIFFAKLCGVSEIICVEPLDLTHSILMKNIEINKLSGVRTVKAALGSRDGFANMFAYSPRNIGGSSLIAEKLENTNLLL